MLNHPHQPVYIVTGAAGHLGGSIGDKIKRAGADCVCPLFGRRTTSAQGEHVQIFYGDVCDVDSMVDLFEACANKSVRVIHCAGLVSISSKFNQKVYDVNVLGTRNILSPSSKTGP